MRPCAACDATILFGGVKTPHGRYCNPKCASAAAHLRAVADAIPPEVMAREIAAVHDGPCPKCHRNVRVDYYRGHAIWSIILLIKISRTRVFCCRRCARKHQAFQLLGSILAGWWSIPFGPIATVVQITRNIIELSKPESPEPSRELIAEVQTKLGKQLAQLPRG